MITTKISVMFLSLLILFGCKPNSSSDTTTEEVDNSFNALPESTEGFFAPYPYERQIDILEIDEETNDQRITLYEVLAKDSMHYEINAWYAETSHLKTFDLPFKAYGYDELRLNSKLMKCAEELFFKTPEESFTVKILLKGCILEYLYTFNKVKNDYYLKGVFQHFPIRNNWEKPDTLASVRFIPMNYVADSSNVEQIATLVASDWDQVECIQKWVIE